ncbi:DNA-binding response regulator, partial [Streptomyces sp. T21Q-yed]|nr:DNA-binding response regulator [Streptomyces sp. T21Q-yed]
MVRIRVLVVDDHRIFAESLAAALAAEPDVDVSAAG